MPENVMVGSIMVVEQGRLPIDEAVVKDIMATIHAGDMSALPPIHLWRKQHGGDPILVAGRNCLEAHKRCDCEVISARVITGETPEIVRTVQRIELNMSTRRKRRLNIMLAVALGLLLGFLIRLKIPTCRLGPQPPVVRSTRTCQNLGVVLLHGPAFITDGTRQIGTVRRDFVFGVVAVLLLMAMWGRAIVVIDRMATLRAIRSLSFGSPARNTQSMPSRTISTKRSPSPMNSSRSG